MKAIELIRWAMTLSDGAVKRVVEDLRPTPLLTSTPGAKGGDGNHALWIMGHLAAIEGSLPHTLLGRPNPVAGWMEMFGQGTTPSKDASRYPPFEEVLRTFHELRAKNLALLEEIGEAGLDKVPTNIPPGFEKQMTSVGNTFMLIAMHTMMHHGQLADARRVAGFKPMM